MKETIFIAGINSVGKSTLVKQVSQKLNIPMFNASDLISEINNEDYSKFKNV